MHTIHQVMGGWEVRVDGVKEIFFPLKIFEIHSDSEAYLEAIDYVREADGYGTYYDFTAITVHNVRAA